MGVNISVAAEAHDKQFKDSNNLESAQQDVQSLSNKILHCYVSGNIIAAAHWIAIKALLSSKPVLWSAW